MSDVKDPKDEIYSPTIKVTESTFENHKLTPPEHQEVHPGRRSHSFIVAAKVNQDLHLIDINAIATNKIKK